MVKYLHDAESLVKSYETRLCAEEGVPAEPERVQQYIAQIKVGVHESFDGNNLTSCAFTLMLPFSFCF